MGQFLCTDVFDFTDLVTHYYNYAQTGRVSNLMEDRGPGQTVHLIRYTCSYAGIC